MDENVQPMTVRAERPRFVDGIADREGLGQRFVVDSSAVCVPDTVRSGRKVLQTLIRVVTRNAQHVTGWEPQGARAGCQGYIDCRSTGRLGEGAKRVPGFEGEPSPV